MMPLTIPRFQLINEKRSLTWHEGKRIWTPVDWSNALAGEVGELCNLAKKLQRARDGIKSKHFDPSRDRLSFFEASTIDQMADEIADVIIYGSLNASKLGLDLEWIIKKKFNADSEVIGLSERL